MVSRFDVSVVFGVGSIEELLWRIESMTGEITVCVWDGAMGDRHDRAPELIHNTSIQMQRIERAMT